jgi:type II secretory pathway pseudopilin PulG
MRTDRPATSPSDPPPGPHAPAGPDQPPLPEGAWQVSLRRPRAHSAGGAHAPGLVPAFTLVEALIATVIVAMVALAGSTAVAVGVAIEEGNRMSVLATQAAELQMGSVLEQGYEGMEAMTGTEERGAMLAPAAPGTAARPSMGPRFAQMSRQTTVTAQNRTFPSLNNHTVVGKRVEVRVFGPDGTELARLVRFRGTEPTT